MSACIAGRTSQPETPTGRGDRKMQRSRQVAWFNIVPASEAVEPPSSTTQSRGMSPSNRPHSRGPTSAHRFMPPESGPATAAPPLPAMPPGSVRPRPRRRYPPCRRPAPPDAVARLPAEPPAPVSAPVAAPPVAVGPESTGSLPPLPDGKPEPLLVELPHAPSVAIDGEVHKTRR